jgi:hypothetical protein
MTEQMPATSSDEAVARGYMIEVDASHPTVQRVGHHPFIENYKPVANPECERCHVELGNGKCSDCKLECLWQDRLVEEELERQRDLISHGINPHPNMRHFISTLPARQQEPVMSKKCTICNNVDIAMNRTYCAACKAARNSEKRRENYKRRKLLQ